MVGFQEGQVLGQAVADHEPALSKRAHHSHSPGLAEEALVSLSLVYSVGSCVTVEAAMAVGEPPCPITCMGCKTGG